MMQSRLRRFAQPLDSESGRGRKRQRAVLVHSLTLVATARPGRSRQSADGKTSKGQHRMLPKNGAAILLNSGEDEVRPTARPRRWAVRPRHENSPVRLAGIAPRSARGDLPCADVNPEIVSLGHDTYALTHWANNGFTRNTEKVENAGARGCRRVLCQVAQGAEGRQHDDGQAGRAAHRVRQRQGRVQGAGRE
jgi:hypothetical protein